MTERIHEQLSACADDELEAAEFRLLWQRMAHDPELRARWARHFLVGDALRDALPPATRQDFAARVGARVATLPTVTAPDRRWLRRAGGLVVAASVAVVALVSLRVDDPVLTEPAVVVPSSTASTITAGARFASGPGVQWERARPEVQQQLNQYLLNHADEAVQPTEVAESSLQNGGAL